MQERLAFLEGTKNRRVKLQESEFTFLVSANKRYFGAVCDGRLASDHTSSETSDACAYTSYYLAFQKIENSGGVGGGEQIATVPRCAA